MLVEHLVWFDVLGEGSKGGWRQIPARFVPTTPHKPSDRMWVFELVESVFQLNYKITFFRGSLGTTDLMHIHGSVSYFNLIDMQYSL